MADKQRVALVETRIQGNDGSPLQLIRYQIGNHLGSASLELDDTGQIISYEEYYPYGSSSYQAVRSQTETPKRYRYTGMERDDENGLNYHGSRYYAPWLGRWASCDPKETASNTPPVKSTLGDARYFSTALDQRDSREFVANRHGQNLYLYCSDNPVGFIDLNGEDPSSWDLVGFRVWHSTLAKAVGLPEGRGYFSSSVVPVPSAHPNITSLAVRFSNYLPVDRNQSVHEGSNTNAIRHAIWQGLITRDFSAEDAKFVGDFHEDNPTRDLSVSHFENPKANRGNVTNPHDFWDLTEKEWSDIILANADETIDLLNNERARTFYTKIQDKTNKGIVQYYLGVFESQGFYVADITYNTAHTAFAKVDVKLQRLDEPTYVRAMRSLTIFRVGLLAKRRNAAKKRRRRLN
jgi:RHS repeat-associated protein